MRKTGAAIRNNGLATFAALLMLSSAAVRIWAYRDIAAQTTKFTILQCWLPLLCNLLFAILLLAFGRRTLVPTVLPVLAGCAFFVCRIVEPATGVSAGTWHIALCCCLYTLVGTLYALTAAGVIRAKWPLILVFALPLAYHVCAALFNMIKYGSPPAAEFSLPEISVDLIMAALLAMACSIRKK